MTIDPQDRAEILDLISKYVYSVDEQDWDLFGTLWADDAVQSSRTGEASSRLEIVSRYKALVGQIRANPDSRWSRHHTTNTILWEIGQDRVAGKSRWFNHLSRFSEPRTVVGNSGHYVDEFVRTPQGWKFASRRIEHNAD